MRVDHQGDAHGLDRLVDPGIGEDIALVAGVGFAAQGLAGFDKVVDAALAFLQVGALAIVDDVRDPVGDQRLGAGVPQRTIDAVGLGIDDIEPPGRWGGLGTDMQLRGRNLAVGVADQLKDVGAGRREGGRSDRRRRIGKGNGAQARDLAPQHQGIAIRGQGVDLAHQIGLAATDDDAVDTGGDHRRKGRNRPCAHHPPLQDAGGIVAVGDDLQSQLVGGHRLKGRRVEGIARQAQTLGIFHRGPGRAGPVQQAAGFRCAHALPVHPPIDLDAVGGHRPGPVVLDPLRIRLRPIAVHAGDIIGGIGRRRAVLDGDDLGVARCVERGRRRDLGQVDRRLVSEGSAR